jgi:hypothetical protein
MSSHLNFASSIRLLRDCSAAKAWVSAPCTVPSVLLAQFARQWGCWSASRLAWCSRILALVCWMFSRLPSICCAALQDGKSVMFSFFSVSIRTLQSEKMLNCSIPHCSSCSLISAVVSWTDNIAIRIDTRVEGCQCIMSMHHVRLLFYYYYFVPIWCVI